MTIGRAVVLVLPAAITSVSEAALATESMRPLIHQAMVVLREMTKRE
jgi:hypothetical protein